MAAGRRFPSRSWGAWGDAGTGLKVCCVVCAVVGTELGSRLCEIRERPKRRSCPHTTNIQRETTVQKLPSYWSESTFRLPGVELGCTNLDFVMYPRRFVSSSSHDWRQNEAFHSLQHLLGQDFIKELVSLFHNLDSIFQSAPERNENHFYKSQSQLFGMHQKAKRYYICLGWHLQGYQKMPQI